MKIPYVKIILFIIIYSIIILFSEKLVIENFIVAPPDVEIGEYIFVFQIFSVLYLLISFALGILWIVVISNNFSFTLEELRSSKYRNIWSVLLAVSMIIPLLGNMFFLKDPSSGKLLTYGLSIFLNSSVPYYLLTLAFNYPGLRFIPIFATKIRKGW